MRYLHEAPDVLLFLEEVLVEPAPVGDKLQYLPLSEEGVFALLLAPAAGTAVGESSQGDNKGQCAGRDNVCVWLYGHLLERILSQQSLAEVISGHEDQVGQQEVIQQHF